MSREAESVIAEHEYPPDPGLMYHNDRPRLRVRNRLARAEMLDDTE